MRNFIRTLTEAFLASVVFVSPVLANGTGYNGDPPAGGDVGGPLPILGAGLPFLAVVGGAYLVARFLMRRGKQRV